MSFGCLVENMLFSDSFLTKHSTLTVNIPRLLCPGCTVSQSLKAQVNDPTWSWLRPGTPLIVWPSGKRHSIRATFVVAVFTCLLGCHWSICKVERLCKSKLNYESLLLYMVHVLKAYYRVFFGKSLSLPYTLFLIQVQNLNNIHIALTIHIIPISSNIIGK